ncbi:5'-methylthioadenosine/adenosylhomocysteine nucleosidase [Desertibacillus haloalkaliphilus]|uniref:5'-methylthioadenosine/adenosylhomocysteine nucleosidase n=1 Tax=Desertibacillus haloalkaliphilus TaxID=1328930 RepID=UPI001C27CC6A|nr:5'-methylthioadenosine/adenosylhomocysteine nucleosidase [Desertibacillus haloalkaliphilus]MBU8905213.1 5'-methylthioadenosine/adenosylhomocysteine nucleosidase [Desertibacillus haloalkaliphilus]
MKIGIIGAMDEEIDFIQREMTVESERVHATITFYEGQFAGRQVVLCKSGVGKVNASVTTQVLHDVFAVDCLIFTGVAGALDPQLEIGDIVISTSAIQHDLDASPLGFKRGEVPMFAYSSDFQADQNLVDAAYRAAEALEGAVVKGRMVSGDQFIADRKHVEQLRKEFDAKCVEMEGAAVAHVAMMNHIPFVIIRSMSDKANGEATVNFSTFTTHAAKQSFSIVKQMIEHI